MKICVATGSRAEYGLLKSLMKEINFSSDMKLQIIATGSHLSPKHGNTYTEIESDGFKIDKKINMLLESDEPGAVATSVGVGIIGVASALTELAPDLLLIVGDRYEMLAFASSALVMNIPIAHIHGGELTEGLIDDSIRHAITKMSTLHFVAAEVYKKRVIQLGEESRRVFNVGGLGVQALLETKFLSKKSIEKCLDIKLSKQNYLVTFHPVTLDPGSENTHIQELLKAIKVILRNEDTTIIFTSPNADIGGSAIGKMIAQFTEENKNTHFFVSLGSQLYFSLVKICDGVLGNSSSALLEVPSFKKGSINIGVRQKGRIRAASVIDCNPKEQSILEAWRLLTSKKFQKQLKTIKNPYGDGGATRAIIKVIRTIDLKKLKYKIFNDLSF